MTHIIVINPNTSDATTAMMTGIVRRLLPAGITADGMTAASGVPMILNGLQLAASVASVKDMGLAAAPRTNGIIIGAFGDPGLEDLRQLLDIPVCGLFESSVLQAVEAGQRFGIATVTPDLVASFSQKAAALKASSFFTGTRLTQGDPLSLARDPIQLKAALSIAAKQCVDQDGAEVVIIGGGPLGEAASELRRELSIPIIAPITSAVKSLIRMINDHTNAS
ncbi:aspartate/glutamate racemase family protein [Allorhizobium taibaishanense]|uniref:Hydantoin racemase n=1 Tax=Allorhizobium taibaishanense TaxID=887144 RepID=A0A1Q9ABY7_9HYPH|nr:aspartate/glutamate racemase family protein [Allorhizobium taibaishanense]MBB4010257.1 Asp/Glu/hydantoin racemase [Allorhizobium taibaishanense]OLP52371.1 hydantoin racemase [Allorhizobium taibaishanense]